MASVFFLLLVAFTLDWAKGCKIVNFKYKQFKNKESYISGCKRGCFGYYNDTHDPPAYDEIDSDGTKFDGNRHVQEKCVECSTINKDFVTNWFTEGIGGGIGTPSNFNITDEKLETICNGGEVQIEYAWVLPPIYGGGSIDTHGDFSIGALEEVKTCYWNAKKKTCGTVSCPKQYAVKNCASWKNGKCEKVELDEIPVSSSYLPSDLYDYHVVKARPDLDICCPPSWSSSVCSGLGSSSGSGCDCDGKYYISSSSFPDEEIATCNNLTNYFYIAGYKNDTRTNAYATQTCAVYKQFTAEMQNECKYKVEHPMRYDIASYEWSKQSRKICNKLLGCVYGGGGDGSEGGFCSPLAIWAFVLILVIVILVVLAIIALVCFLIFKLCCGSKSTKVDPAADKAASAPAAKNTPQAAPVGASPVTQGPPPEVGPYVVIKLGKQESKTKKVESAVWGQSIVFTGLGPEDDDVLFELHDNSDALLGSTDVRIPDYVNAKKRATINLKSGDAVIGVLEVDIEIQVQEEPEVKITGVLFVDKFTKA